MRNNQHQPQSKWRYALVAGAIIFTSGLFLFWRSLTAPFSLLFWASLDSAFAGLALVSVGMGWYLWRQKHHISKVTGIGALILSLLLVLAIPSGFLVQDHLYELLLLTEVADSPWEITEMSLDVTVLADEEQIAVGGEARLTLSECCSQSIVLSIPRESMSFDSIASDNHRVDVYRGGSLARITLSETYQTGEEVEVSFSYHNKTNQIDNAIVPFTDFVVEENFAYVVEPYPWYPLPFGSRDPVLAEIAIIVPEGWTTLSNGTVIASQERNDGRAQETWRTRSPARLSFVAGPYDVAREEVNGRTYAVYTLDRPRGTGEAAIGHLVTIMEILESYYGPYPTAGYAMIEVPSQYIHHNAESQIGYLISDPSLLFPGGQLGIALAAHEFSHGWWGDFLENIDPGNKMVNEALAQYSAALVIEQLQGREAMIDFLRFSDPGYVPHQSAHWYFTEILDTGQDVPLIEASHFLANTKGHWFYHMLRNRVGDEAFFGSLREILDTYGGKAASMHDIRAVFEKNSPPEKNIEVFFDQWLERSGIPQLDYTWQIDENNGQLEVTIRQQAEIYDLFVEVGYEDAQREHREVVHITQAAETFTMPTVGEIKEVVLDPDHESLILFPERARVYGS
ncbi:MAG: M1 family aminopeptidase [Kiloniellales bacterium]|nr:M1 family aminopeptidase [Kiloniellales bacterium]